MQTRSAAPVLEKVAETSLDTVALPDDVGSCDLVGVPELRETLLREAVEVPLVVIPALLVRVSERVVVGVSLLLCEPLRVLAGVPAATTTTTAAPTTIHSSTSPLKNGASPRA